MDRWIERVKGWIAGWPTTQTVILSAVGLSWVTGVVINYCFVRRIQIDDGNLTGWLTFLAAALGGATAHYLAKRKTEWKPDTVATLTTTSTTNEAGTVARTEVVKSESATPKDATPPITGAG